MNLNWEHQCLNETFNKGQKHEQRVVRARLIRRSVGEDLWYVYTYKRYGSSGYYEQTVQGLENARRVAEALVRLETT